jgi:uncharacterized protein
MIIRDATTRDFAAIAALNLAFEHFLSPMNEDRLALLHAQASCHRVVEHDGAVVAFLMAHREGTGYDSDNYAWFSRRYPQFLYIDRVVVGLEMQGLGVARCLYDHVFAWAAAQHLPCVVLEFDSDPPNAGSEQFHRKMGFTHVGFHTSANTGKRVNMQLKPVLVAASSTE